VVVGAVAVVVAVEAKEAKEENKEDEEGEDDEDDEKEEEEEDEEEEDPNISNFGSFDSFKFMPRGTFCFSTKEFRRVESKLRTLRRKEDVWVVVGFEEEIEDREEVIELRGMEETEDKGWDTLEFSIDEVVMNKLDTAIEEFNEDEVVRDEIDPLIVKFREDEVSQ